LSIAFKPKKFDRLLNFKQFIFINKTIQLSEHKKHSKVNRHLTDTKPAYDHSETGRVFRDRAFSRIRQFLFDLV
jgi:hypothetical protein